MRIPKFPTMIGWSVTQRCNLNCSYCSQSAGEIHPNELTTEEALKVVDQIGKYRASVIGFTGGEPFLRPDLEKLVDRALANRLRCVITTNGTRLPYVEKSFLVKFIKIRISLDSPFSELHETVRGKKGIFDEILKAITRIQNLGIKVEVVTTISRHNAEIVDEMHNFLETLKIEEWSVSIFMPAGRGRDTKENLFSPNEYKKIVEHLVELKSRSKMHLKTDIPQNALILTHLQEKPGEHYCSAATDLMVIFPAGDIGPCFTVSLTDGNIRTHDLYQVWNESSLFNAFRNKSLLKGNCGDCELVEKCGGCRAHALAKTGDLLFGDPLCWYKPLDTYWKGHTETLQTPAYLDCRVMK